MIYKLTILSYIEYARFLLIACTIDGRHDLQICQNDALCICIMKRLTDHVRIDELHAKCEIISREQCWRIKSVAIINV